LPIFEILLHGRGLELLDENGAKRQGGVYVWRAVHAENETLALATATEQLLLEPEFLEEVWNESLGGVSFEADEIREKSATGEAHDTGFVFYIEEDE
jgi:hypothetical protein